MSAIDHDPEFERVVDKAARAWLREHGETVSDHPDAETLIAYQEGGLEDRESEVVRRHLVVCATCLEEVQALKRFDAADLAEPTDELAERASWRTFVEWRGRELRSAQDFHAPGPPWALLVAASAVLAVVGLGSLILLWTLSTPADATAYAFDLLADGASLQREAESETEIPVPAGVETLVATLNVGDQTPFDRYDITLEESGGETLVRCTDAVRDAQGRFSLLIPRRQVPASSYRVLLTGWSAGQQSGIATYSFRLVDAE